MPPETKKLKLMIRQHSKAIHAQGVTQKGPPFRLAVWMRKEAEKVASVLRKSGKLEDGYYDLLLMDGNVVLDQEILIA